MALLHLRDVDFGFGDPPLLVQVNLRIDPRERVCLVGRNGVGKSTLMRLIAGELEPDGGELTRQQGLRVARLTQDVPRELAGSVFDEAAAGLGELGDALAEYHHLSLEMAQGGGDRVADRLDRAERALDAAGAWQAHRQVEAVLSRMGLDPDARCEALSAGLKRRVLLAKALVTGPDILLLDEPTNHLDLDAICWLEEFLLKCDAALLFVTHDRMFLRKLATRIIELDRGQLTSWACDYDTYLKRKQSALEAEANQQALFDKRLSEEEAWIRQGIKARRTRNEGRVRALMKMREERRARREVLGTVRMQIQEAERTGRLVIDAKGISAGYGDKTVISDFSTRIMRGDKVGIVGPNGSGKTTLLRVLLGEMPPQQGTVRHGTRLEIIYFDQLHAQLDEEESVLENVGQGSDSVVINGKKKHLYGYLQDFLFTPERARTPVKFLSGGERNRLLLARLFTKPSNVLVLDEPTNDLDTETLELLEERLLEYSGTLLVVSHDRDFLNNVATTTLAFEGDDQVKEYAGGYDDWLTQRKADVPPPTEEKPKQKPSEATSQKPAVSRPQGPKRLTYKEQLELKELPERIESLEAQVDQLHQTMADPAFYQQEGTKIAEAKAELEVLETELAGVYERWESLEERS